MIKTLKQKLATPAIIIVMFLLGACLHDGDSGANLQEGALSEWSDPKNVTDLYIIRETNRLRFVLDGSNPPRPLGVPPHVECVGSNVERRQLDLHIDVTTPDEEAKIKMLTDILFSAFIEELPVQVRSDTTSCSNGNRFLVRDIRIFD